MDKVLGESWEAVINAVPKLATFIYDYQSLVAGVLAIWAACIAARPVWRQLDQMNIQGSTIFREFLHDRIRIVSRRQKWIMERARKFDEDLGRDVHHFVEVEDGDINVHWAFDQNQRTDSLLEEIKQFQERATEPLMIIERSENLVTELSSLSNTLYEIHATSSNEQHDEDHSYTDEEWEELRQRGLNAEKELPAKASALSSSIKALDEAFSVQLAELRDKVKKTDQLLMAPR